MAKNIACVKCGEIPATTKTKTPQGMVNMCEDCNKTYLEDKKVRGLLIEYIAIKQNLKLLSPHSLKQLKDLHDQGYQYKDLLTCAKFYYEVEGNVCDPKYSYTVAWMEKRAIPNTWAYIEMMDLTIEELYQKLEVNIDEKTF